MKQAAAREHPKLFGNIVSLYVLQGLNYVIPMAVLPYLIRVLGMEKYGQVAYAQAFAQYFVIFTDYGFNFSATRSIAQHREDESKVGRIFSSVLLIKFLFTILGAVVLYILVAALPQFRGNRWFFMVAYLAVVGNVAFPLWYFQGIERMRYISAIVGTSRILGAIALFIFVHRSQDALLCLAIQSLALLGGGLTGLCIALWKLRHHLILPKVGEIRASLADGWHLFISTAAISLYTNTNVFLVGTLAGNLEAGYFSAAEKLIRALQGLIMPVSQAMFPHMSSLAAKSRERAIVFARKTLMWVGSVGMGSSLAVFVFAHPIVSLCYGQAAAGCVPIIRWIALIPFLVAVSNVLGTQTMVTFGLDRQFSRLVILAGLFNIGAAIPLIRFWGARGAGASVLMTEILVTTSMIAVLRRGKILTLGQEAVYK